MRARLGLLIAAVTLVAAGCGGKQSTLAPAGKPAREIATLWWWMLLAACVVFAGALAMIGLAWVRRRRPGEPLMRGGKRQFALVVVFGIVIPLVTNVALFVVANFVVIHETEAPAEASTPLTIEVTGHQWFWEVRYPGTPAVSANEIHIPVRTRVNVIATTGDVIHSFWVPRLNRKIDMIPGRRNRILLYADNPGLYRGQCAEFCGLEHAHMAMYVQAQEPADFRRWLRAESAGARAPTTPEQQAGRRAFFRDRCADCHALRGTPARGDVGPDLTHVGSRTTIAALTLPMDTQGLTAWLRDPQHVKPGNRMPNLDLRDADVRSLVAYLESLK